MSLRPSSSVSGQGDVLCSVNYRIDNGMLQSDKDPDTNSLVRPTHVKLMNARERGHFTLRQNGFVLLDQKTGMARADYFDDRKVKSTYYPLCAEAVKCATGAAAVECFHYMVRGHAGKPFAGIAHADYSTVTAHKLLQDVIPQGMPKPFKGRICVVNLWRNINQASPIQNHHLAMCDGSSVVAPDDFVPYQAADNSTGETVRMFHMSPNNHQKHKWYFFPMMTAEEVLIFMQYDSDPHRQCRYTFHSSVSVQDDTLEYNRESIEVRCVAWFPDEENNTLPDLSVPANLAVPAAVSSLKDMTRHLKEWDEGGQRHTMDWILAHRWVEWITNQCKHHRKQGIKGAFVNLTDSQIEEVARTLEQDEAWKKFMLDTCGSLANASDIVSQAADRVMEAARTVNNWDEGGKVFAKGCSESGDIGKFVTNFCTHMKSLGTYPWQDLKQSDMEAVVEQCRKRGVKATLKEAVAKI